MKIFSLDSDIQFIKKDDTGVIHFKFQNAVYLLNETAFFILNCADNKNFEQIVCEICSHYSVSDEYYDDIKKDCSGCLDYLVQQKLLHIIEN